MAYRFDDFKWLANMAGFGLPSDVYWATIYLGKIESQPDGYAIKLVDTPNGKQKIKSTPNNKFKSKNQAADALHRTWKKFRFGGDEAVPA